MKRKGVWLPRDGCIWRSYGSKGTHNESCGSLVEPNISSEFVPIPRAHPSASTYAHPSPPMNNNIAPMPTQNPWAWVGMGMDMDMGMCMGTQCRLMEFSRHLILDLSWMQSRQELLTWKTRYCVDAWARGRRCLLNSIISHYIYTYIVMAS